jgi:hypothetical protein
MGVGLLNQPLLRIPRAVRALSREPLDTAAPADVLNAKPDKLSSRPDRNMKVTAGAAAARLGPATRLPFVGHTDLPRDDVPIRLNSKWMFDLGQHGAGHLGVFLNLIGDLP